MSALPDASRAKLAKLLGLLGSAHAGERDAAGLAANRLISQAGLSWRQAPYATFNREKIAGFGHLARDRGRMFGPPWKPSPLGGRLSTRPSGLPSHIDKATICAERNC
jgi:hypothetical protein